MKKAFLKSLVLAYLLFPLATFAEDGNSRISVGVQWQEDLSPNDLACEKRDPANMEPRAEEGACGFLFDKYPPIYYPSAIHWVVAVSALGDSVELEDGSVWKISSYDGFKVLNWRDEDPLMITQNHRWFSRYNYRIVNKNTGSSLEANIHLGPIQDGEYTRYITAINPDERILIFNDLTHWEICACDFLTFRDWAINDAVIIGYNSGWESNYESLLINVNMNNFLRAKQF